MSHVLKKSIDSSIHLLESTHYDLERFDFSVQKYCTHHTKASFPTRVGHLAIFKMHFTTFVSLSLVCFLRVSNVDAGQFALRHQPRSQLLSRSPDNDAAFFEPTDEESFFMAAGELTKTIPYIILKTFLLKPK